MLFLRYSQPAFWPPRIRIISKSPLMTIRHVRTHPHNGAALEEAAADLNASIRYDALERQAKRRMETRRLVDAGV